MAKSRLSLASNNVSFGITWAFEVWGPILYNKYIIYWLWRFHFQCKLHMGKTQTLRIIKISPSFGQYRKLGHVVFFHRGKDLEAYSIKTKNSWYSGFALCLLQSYLKNGLKCMETLVVLDLQIGKSRDVIWRKQSGVITSIAYSWYYTIEQVQNWPPNTLLKMWSADHRIKCWKSCHKFSQHSVVQSILGGLLTRECMGYKKWRKPWIFPHALP